MHILIKCNAYQISQCYVYAIFSTFFSMTIIKKKKKNRYLNFIFLTLDTLIKSLVAKHKLFFMKSSPHQSLKLLQDFCYRNLATITNKRVSLYLSARTCHHIHFVMLNYASKSWCKMIFFLTDYTYEKLSTYVRRNV